MSAEPTTTLPETPLFAPLLLPADLQSLEAGAPYEMAVLSATYGVSPLLRPLREAARHHAHRLLVDPRTAHFQYEGYMSMEDYRALPYSPGRTTLGTLWQPRDFAEADRRRELADQVLALQREMGADLLLAPYFLVPEAEHPWLEVAVETATAAAGLVDERPLGVPVCVELDALIDPDDRERLGQAWAALRPDFFWVVVVDYDEVEAWPDEVRAVLDLVERLGARAPTFLSHSGRTGLVNLRANTYYDRGRMIHLPVRPAEAAAATGLADRCDCRACAGRPITRMVSRRLVAHALRCRRDEIGVLAAVVPGDRLDWLRRRFDAALDLNRRTRDALEEEDGPEELRLGAFHYLEVLREICGGPTATIPEDEGRDL